MYYLSIHIIYANMGQLNVLSKYLRTQGSEQYSRAIHPITFSALVRNHQEAAHFFIYFICVISAHCAVGSSRCSSSSSPSTLTSKAAPVPRTAPDVTIVAVFLLNPLYPRRSIPAPSPQCGRHCSQPCTVEPSAFTNRIQRRHLCCCFHLRCSYLPSFYTRSATSGLTRLHGSSVVLCLERRRQVWQGV